jgi:hypothetical protein
MSPPDERMTASFSPEIAVTDSGTSLMFSDFFCAVTITSSTWVVVWASVPVAKVSTAAAAPQARLIRWEEEVVMGRMSFDASRLADRLSDIYTTKACLRCNGCRNVTLP